MMTMSGPARAGGLAVHVDGARIFNAAIALGCDAEAIAAGCDSVSFCLSKGLGCPVGSLVCGSREFVTEARRNRKMLGGGMRQAGILAAAGIFALEHNVRRLADDHENAARLAEGLNKLGVFRAPGPQTNIVVVDVLSGSLEVWVERLREAGVLAVPFGPQRLRMVTHLDVDAAAISEALDRISRVAGAVAA
jgi:threonine aldolase